MSTDLSFRLAEPYVGEDGLWCIPMGVDYADAITWATRMAGPPYSHMFVKADRMGISLPALYRVELSDWWDVANDLARAAGRRIVRLGPHGMFALFDLNAEEAREDVDREVRGRERELALRLAWQMGELNVDAMIKRLSKAQWAEWKAWLS